MQNNRLVNGFLLCFLGAAAKQDDQGFAILGQVDAIAWSPVDLVLTNTPKSNDVRGIAEFKPGLGDRNLGGGLCIQPVEPSLVGAGAIFLNVFFEPNLYAATVTYALPLIKLLLCIRQPRVPQHGSTIHGNPFTGK